MSESIASQIAKEVGSWEGVEFSPHRYGGLEFRVGRRELGHLHGDRFADLPFPISIRRSLVQEGKADVHHILPNSGWVSRRIRSTADVMDVIELFRLNYERPWLNSKS